MRGQTDSLSAVVWEELLLVQLFDGLTKFYFVNWRAGVVIAVSTLDLLPSHTLNLLLEDSLEERVRSNSQPLPSWKYQVCFHRVRLLLVATALHPLHLRFGSPRECIKYTGSPGNL